METIIHFPILGVLFLRDGRNSPFGNGIEKQVLHMVGHRSRKGVPFLLYPPLLLPRVYRPTVARAVRVLDAGRIVSLSVFFGEPGSAGVGRAVLCLWSEVGHPHGGGSRFGAVILHD